MPRFFIRGTDLYTLDGIRFIRIVGEDAHHLTHVLRTRIGEAVQVCDGEGHVYETVLETPGEEVLLRILSESAVDTEPPYVATVYQALVKGDKMETVIQKATETGASVIVPVITSRCTVKLDSKDAVKKTERWQKIACEAAKQCGRGILPKVMPPMSFAEAVREAAAKELPLFCYEGEGTVPLPQLCSTAEHPADISIFIGPEGGFSEKEVEAVRNAGIRPCGLGKRILRTETAAVFVLSCLSAAYELS